MDIHLERMQHLAMFGHSLYLNVRAYILGGYHGVEILMFHLLGLEVPQWHWTVELESHLGFQQIKDHVLVQQQLNLLHL